MRPRLFLLAALVASGCGGSDSSPHPAGNAINSDNVVRDTGVEFNPGAIRYYRDIDIWPES